ncbi:hypothetical protein CR513_10640, partial [Mucuna pruriens]
MADGQLISIMAEKELIINTPLPIEYIEGDEEALETSFQALEIIDTANANVEGGDPKPSRAAVKAAKVLINNGFQIGKGLGRELHTIAEPIDNATLTSNNAGESSRSNEGDDMEEEDLEVLERPRLQSGAEEIEVINLGEEGEVKEIWVGKLMLSDLRKSLVELLREYVDIFAWSYRDMPGLDTSIVEHGLPLVPNVVLVRQQLSRMKLEVALKIKEEVEK